MLGPATGTPTGGRCRGHLADTGSGFLCRPVGAVVAGAAIVRTRTGG